ncbi:MAG: hypothetical protein ACT4QA_15615 [Panacagrimonas sp.]
MTELNSVRILDEPVRVFNATVTGASTIDLNDLDTSAARTCLGGGVIKYQMPVDLPVRTSAAMQIRSRVDSTDIVLSFSTTDSSIVFDDTTKTITPIKSVALTAALTWVTGVWDLEAFSAAASAGEIGDSARGWKHFNSRQRRRSP